MSWVWHHSFVLCNCYQNIHEKNWYSWRRTISMDWTVFRWNHYIPVHATWSVWLGLTWLWTPITSASMSLFLIFPCTLLHHFYLLIGILLTAAQAFKDKGIFTETGVKPPKCLSVIKWIILLLESSLDHNTAKLTVLMLLKSDLFEESYQCALHQNTTFFLDCYFKQTAAGVWPCWFSMR